MVVVDSTIAAIVFPILPDFVRGLKNPVLWYSLSISLFRLTQLFTAPLLGYLADKWGRRPIFLLATTGTFVSYLFMIPLNLPALLANRLMDGSTNGFYTAVRSAVTDLSNATNLAKNLGILGALGATGVVLGPALGAFLLGHGPFRYSITGNQRILFCALLLALFNITLAFFIKETLPSKIKSQSNKSKTIDPTTIEDSKQIQNLDYAELPIPVAERFRYRDLIPQFMDIWKNNRSLGLLIVMELLMVIVYGYYNYFLIFADKRLHFQSQDVAWFMVYIGICIASSQIIFFNWLVNKLPYKKTLFFSGIVGSIVLVCYSLVRQTWMLYFFVIFDVISLSLIGGIVQGLIGKYSPKHKRASIVGLVQGFSGVVAFLNPLIYGYLGEIHINLPFFWFAICALAVGIISMQLTYPDFDKTEATHNSQVAPANP